MIQKNVHDVRRLGSGPGSSFCRILGRPLNLPEVEFL